LTWARELDHPHSLAQALFQTARLHQLCRDGQAAQPLAQETIQLATEKGFPFFIALGTVIHGWSLNAQDHVDEGIAQVEEGLIAFQATGAELARATQLCLLAETYGNIDQAEKGIELLDEALELVEKTGLRYDEADMHRLKGELLLRHRVSDPFQAETCFHQALDIARHQQAKSLELRAATSLARLWQSQGKRQDAYDLLAPVYAWFTEGFDTADLKDAKALLDELSEGSS
jgi:predicted ATPase